MTMTPIASYEGSFKYGTAPGTEIEFTKGSINTSATTTDIQTNKDQGYQKPKPIGRKATASITAFWDQEGAAPTIKAGDQLTNVVFLVKNTGTLGYTFPTMTVTESNTSLDVTGVTMYDVTAESFGPWTQDTTVSAQSVGKIEPLPHDEVEVA